MTDRTAESERADCNPIYCGFCGKAHYEVERMFVTSLGRTICLSCASLCLDIYRQETQRPMLPGDIAIATTPPKGASQHDTD